MAKTEAVSIPAPVLFASSQQQRDAGHRENRSNGMNSAFGAKSARMAMLRTNIASVTSRTTEVVLAPAMAARPYIGDMSTLTARSRAVSPNVRMPTSLLADSRSKPTSITTASAIAILNATAFGGKRVTPSIADALITLHVLTHPQSHGPHFLAKNHMRAQVAFNQRRREGF